jgi:staphylococcal nuclease domain-containing protein 1
VRPQEEEAAEPWALEAQEFTELRLLHRDVTVTLQGTDKLGNYFGTIGYPKGNISIKLLELGFGRLVPWSAALTPDHERLKQAEAVAKQKKLRVWSGAAAEDGEEKTGGGAAGVSGPSDYQGKVVQVNSGDSLLVLDADGVERKVSLASVRAPRLGRRGEKDEPFALEAKEFMRSRLVGHKVKVLLEYSRSPPADSKDQEERSFVTVFQGKLNMNEALLAAGLAEVIRHRVDEERSQFYDSYLSAEHAAEEAHRGKFGKQPASAKMVDLTDKPRPDRRRRDEAAAAAAASAAAGGEEAADGGEEAAEKKVDPKEEERLSKAKALTAKARTYLSFFQRDKNVSAVVEYVFTPSRFKLAVHKESVLISFALGGVRTPGGRDAEGNPDPVYEKALQFVRSRVLQHTVRIEVDALDKGDNFLGSLFIGKLNLAVELLKEGLASLVDFSARKSPHSAELFAAEAEAKQAKRGQWENYVPQPDEEKKDGQAGAETEGVHSSESGDAKEALVGVKVTEIEDANDFYVHFSSDKGVELVESKLRDFGSRQAEAGGSAESFTPHHGSIAAGQFNDGNWYRVRVESSTAAGDFRVFFLDYGNHDTLPADKVRPLPAELTKLPALAHHATLAGIAAPKGEDYRDAAALAFNDAVWGQELQAKVELVGFDKLLHLTLTHDSSPVSINKQLLRDGNARVVSRAAAASIRQLLPELLEHQEFAKQNHYNIWEYGDVSDDEDDAGKPQQQTGAAAQRKK